MTRTTYNIRNDQKQRIEKLAIEASLKIGRIVKWTEIMEILIKEYAKDAQSTLMHRESEKTASNDNNQIKNANSM